MKYRFRETGSGMDSEDPLTGEYIPPSHVDLKTQRGIREILGRLSKMSKSPTLPRRVEKLDRNYPYKWGKETFVAGFWVTDKSGVEYLVDLRHEPFPDVEDGPLREKRGPSGWKPYWVFQLRRIGSNEFRSGEDALKAVRELLDRGTWKAGDDSVRLSKERQEWARLSDFKDQRKKRSGGGRRKGIGSMGRGGRLF